MRRMIFACIFLLTAVVCQAQKTINDPNAQVRAITSFQGVSVSGGIDLFLSYGDEAVAVSASKLEHRDRIKTEVVNGVLKIYYDYKAGVGFSGDKKLKAYVSYKNLNNLTASGGSDIFVDGSIKSQSLRLNISGGSDFTGSVQVTDLNVDQSGGSDVKIAGSATKVDLEASGGSDFQGYDLVAETVMIEASGGSDVEITATKELSAKASGASDISYKGKALVKESKASGASSVSQKSK